MCIRLRPYIFLFLATMVVIGGGCVTLLWQVQQGQNASAGSSYSYSVVGQPTLPAANVDAIFARMGSPMQGTGKDVEQAARQTNIDDAFALAVWWTETNDGAAGVGRADRNPGSVRGSAGYPAAFDGYTIYPSYSAAIYDWFNLLSNRYINQGLTTVSAISQPYVGTSGSGRWAAKVGNLMSRYRGEAPPQQATPTSTPKPITTAAATPTRPAVVIGDQPVSRASALRPLRSQGQVREASRPDNVRSDTKHSATTTQLHSEIGPPQSPPGTPFILGLALLSAAGIALWGVQTRRRVPAIADLSLHTQANPAVQEPERFVDYHVPTSKHDPVSLELANGFSFQQEKPSSSPVLATSAASNMADHWSNASALSRHNTLKPINMKWLPLEPDEEDSQGTKVWQRRPGLSLHSREPELVGAGVGSQGLLQRYKEEMSVARE